MIYGTKKISLKKGFFFFFSFFLLLQDKIRNRKVRLYCRGEWKKFSVHQAEAFVLCDEGNLEPFLVGIMSGLVRLGEQMQTL